MLDQRKAADHWDTLTVVTSVLGFVFIFMIWWMYFDSFPLLINSEHDADGDAILYSQLLTYVSFAILANMIRHAILKDLNVADFRIMVIVGTIMFYLGKQIALMVAVSKKTYNHNSKPMRSHVYDTGAARMALIAGQRFEAELKHSAALSLSLEEIQQEAGWLKQIQEMLLADGSEYLDSAVKANATVAEFEDDSSRQDNKGENHETGR